MKLAWLGEMWLVALVSKQKGILTSVMAAFYAFKDE
jgi:hypothetical protein